MVDNVGYTPGIGSTVAADEIGGILFQRMKMIIGIDGVNSGDISAVNPMPVTGTVVTGGLTDAELRAAAVPVSAAALPLPTGAATEATLATRTAAAQLPAALVGGRLDENVGAWLGSTAPTVGQKAMVASVPVVIASDQSAVPVSGTVTANIGTTAGLALDATLTGGTQRTKITDGVSNAAVKAASTAAVAADPALVVAQRQAATGTQTSIVSVVVNVTLLAANAARLGATIYNDSTKILYVKFGATASATSYATQLGNGGYLEVPFGYTGIIDGIWASANGNARVTELT